MDEATKLPIGPEEVAEAAQILQRYKAGKAALDKRLVDNELWFRMGHWKNYQNPMMEGKPQPSSGWLFNSIANKHADAMDNYPSPNVLPRAEDDEAAAQALSSVLPVVLEQADYEQVYSDTWWRKLKHSPPVCHFTTVSHSRMRMVATWARVALPWGFRVVSVTPVISFWALAQARASLA